MIIKFNDYIFPVFGKQFRKQEIDPEQTIPGGILVVDTGESQQIMHITVDGVTYEDIPEGALHDDIIDYDSSFADCILEFLSPEDWAEIIRGFTPEYGGIPFVPAEPIDLGEGGYYDPISEGTTYIYVEESTGELIPVEEQESDPHYSTPEEFFNTRLRDRFAQVIYLPEISMYFILPYSGKEQNEQDILNIDVNIFSRYDIATDKSEITAEIQSLYPKGYFVESETWQEFAQHIDEDQSERMIRYIWSRMCGKNAKANTSDLTVDQLKVFRTWLAQTLLENTPLLEERSDYDTITTMLEYYKNNMYSPVIKAFSDMKDYIKEQPLVIGQTQHTGLQISSGCGCMGGMPALGYTGNTVVCDPIQLYRNAMYNYMVKTFSDIQYWMDQVEICTDMKAYIEGILAVGLPLHTSVIDPYADCTCSSINGDEEQRYRTMLKNLIQALEYIITNKVSGNRNMITTAFTDWATYLYESMYWM